MLSLLNHTPRFCPSCGTPTRLDQAGNYELEIFQAHKALNCINCEAIYQLADLTDIFRAATASGGDMVEYFVGDDGQEESGNERM
jgi:hypothetical protein